MHPGGRGHGSSTRHHACCFACHAHANQHLMQHSPLGNACSLPRRGAEGGHLVPCAGQETGSLPAGPRGRGIAVWPPSNPPRSPYSPTFNLHPPLHACFLRPFSLLNDVRLRYLFPRLRSSVRLSCLLASSCFRGCQFTLLLSPRPSPLLSGCLLIPSLDVHLCTLCFFLLNLLVHLRHAYWDSDLPGDCPWRSATPHLTHQVRTSQPRNHRQ